MEVGTEQKSLTEKSLGILEPGEKILVRANNSTARFLVVSAEPLNETVARAISNVKNPAAAYIHQLMLVLQLLLLHKDQEDMGYPLSRYEGLVHRLR